LREQISQSLKAPRRLTLHCPGTATKCMRCLLGAQSFDVAKDDSSPHAGSQLTERQEEAPVQRLVLDLGSCLIGWFGPRTFVSIERSASVVDERMHQYSTGVALHMHRPDPRPADVELDQALLDEVLCQMEIAPGQCRARAQKGRPTIQGKRLELLIPSVHDGI
jgi:hypothetical protein